MARGLKPQKYKINHQGNNHHLHRRDENEMAAFEAVKTEAGVTSEAAWASWDSRSCRTERSLRVDRTNLSRLNACRLHHLDNKKIMLKRPILAKTARQWKVRPGSSSIEGGWPASHSTKARSLLQFYQF